MAAELSLVTAAGAGTRHAALPTPGPDFHSAMFQEYTLREVTRLVKKLRELVGMSDRAPEGAFAAVLDELQVYVVDQDILEKTGVGRQVARLRKTAEDPEVAVLADNLLGRWKRDHETRKRAAEGFKEKSGLQDSAAREMEAGLFREATPLGFLEGEGYRSYQRHYKRLCTHLRDAGEGSLACRLQSGELILVDVASLPDEELQSRKRKLAILAAEQEGLRNALGGTKEVEGATVSQEYRCPKCKSDRTAYKELQCGWHNDQQDMTIIVLCLECGERWKEGDDHGLAGS